jgi:predicted XRE-type DNA-binding protein
MKNDDMELVRGSGNVFADFGRPNAGLEQARAIIAAKIISILDDRSLTTREAERQTGVSHSEFSRIRNAQLRRFTLDRMIGILGKLDEDVEVNVTFRPRLHEVVRPQLLILPYFHGHPAKRLFWFQTQSG